MCEVKAKGKLNVPEWLHQKWLSDPKGMSKILHDSGFKKDFPNLHQHVSKSTLPKPIYDCCIPEGAVRRYRGKDPYPKERKEADR